MAVTYRSISELRPYARNARTHSKAQVRKIAESIREFGFTNPVLIDRNDTMVAGHGRVEAAKLLGMEQVPTIRLESLSPAQVRAYVIADNATALKAAWDEDILKVELQNIVLEGEVDIALTGFEIPEIDIILAAPTQKDDPADSLPCPSETVISEPGDLWLLGKHRVLCGDVRSAAALQELMEGRRAAGIWTDPPYNVQIDGHASGNGRVKHQNFAMAAGEMSEPEFISFLESSLAGLARHSEPGSVHFVCIDWRHMGELIAAGRKVYESLLNVCVWSKSNAGMGSFYRSQHELIYVFRHGDKQHRNNIQLGKFGRNRTNIWEYPSINTVSKQRDGEGNLLALHPMVKPVAMVADAILDCSARGDIILDGFLGSGSTLIAAERVGRICYGIELSPQFVDVVIQRWQKYSGDEAVHAGTGRSYTELKEVRHG